MTERNDRDIHALLVDQAEAASNRPRRSIPRRPRRSVGDTLAMLASVLLTIAAGALVVTALLWM